MKTLPKSVVVGPITYSVEEVSDLHHGDEAIFGEINPPDAISCIRIEHDMPLQRKVVTLWHEIVHAILDHAHRRDVPDQAVGVLGFGIAEVLKNNPALRTLAVDDD